MMKNRLSFSLFLSIKYSKAFINSKYLDYRTCFYTAELFLYITASVGPSMININNKAFNG